MKMFTYGVLQHQRILRALCGQDFSMIPATLSGYRKVFLDHDAFAPCAIVTPDNAASVKGHLLLSVSAQDLPLFDQFECVDQGWYQRTECRVEDDSGEIHRAGLYVAGDAGRERLGPDWDEDFFLASGRLDYLESMLLDLNSGAGQS